MRFRRIGGIHASSVIFLGPLVAAVWLMSPRVEGAARSFSSQTERFRLHGRWDLLEYHHYKPDAVGVTVNSVGVGLGRSTLGDSGLDPYGLVWGARPVWSLGFGVLLLGSRLNIGAKFAVAADVARLRDERRSSIDDRATVVTGNLVPYLRWVFLPQQRIRPFVEAHAGFGGASLIYETRPSDATRARDLIWPQVGAMGGIHIFLIDAVSLDLSLGLDYWAPHSKRRVKTADLRTKEEFGKQGDLVNVAVAVGSSIWF